MAKSVKNLLTIIGALSILAGLYSAYKGSEFSTYFSAIFIGAALIGTVYYNINASETSEN